MTLSIFPCTLHQANALVAEFHRHHQPVRGHRFSLGARSVCGTAVGVVIVGRPVARKTDQWLTAEITRLCVSPWLPPVFDRKGRMHAPAACSMLYGAAARAAKAMGYRRIQTFTLPTECGASLRGAGYVCEGEAGGGDWNQPSRGDRRTDQPQEVKLRWARTFP